MQLATAPTLYRPPPRTKPDPLRERFAPCVERSVLAMLDPERIDALAEDMRVVQRHLRSIFTPCDIAELYRIRWEVERIVRRIVHATPIAEGEPGDEEERRTPGGPKGQCRSLKSSVHTRPRPS